MKYILLSAGIATVAILIYIKKEKISSTHLARKPIE